MNQCCFELNLFSESADPVPKTSMNDSFMNWTDKRALLGSLRIVLEWNMDIWFLNQCLFKLNLFNESADKGALPGSLMKSSWSSDIQFVSESLFKSFYLNESWLVHEFSSLFSNPLWKLKWVNNVNNAQRYLWHQKFWNIAHDLYGPFLWYCMVFFETLQPQPSFIFILWQKKAKMFFRNQLCCCTEVIQV